MRRPETVSCPPVADQNFLRHARQIEQLAARILRNTTRIHDPSFYASAQFRNLHRARPQASMQAPSSEPSTAPAPLKRTHSPPFLRGRRRFPVPTKALAVRVEHSTRRAAPVSCPPRRAPAPALPRSAGTKYLNLAHSFPAMRGSAGARLPAGATAAAPLQALVETRLAASQQRHRPGPESPDALSPTAPPRPARFPRAHPCVRSRPRQILHRSSAAADAARDCEGRQYLDSTNPRASSDPARAEIPAMQRVGRPAAAALPRQTRVPGLRKRFADEFPRVLECRYREKCAAGPSPPDRRACAPWQFS